MTLNFAGSYRSHWRGWVESTPSVEERSIVVSVYLRRSDGGPRGSSVCEQLSTSTGLPVEVVEAAADQIVGGYAHVGM